MDLRLFCFCLGSVLFVSLSDAQIGPPVEIMPSDLHYLLHVDYKGGNQSFMGVLVSSNYLITSPDYVASFANSTVVYSGNFLDANATMEHTVKSVLNNGKVSILSVCPSITWIDNEPVAFFFDYFDTSSENTTIEVVYYDRTTSKLMWRNETMLTDNECTAKDTTLAAGQVSAGFVSPDMVCTNFENAANGCKHVRNSAGTVACYPIMILDSEPVALFRDVKCAAGAMTSVTTFYKVPNQVDHIFNNTDAELASSSYNDITRRRARRFRKRN